MATREELQAELETLRAKMAETERREDTVASKRENGAGENGADTMSEPPAETATGQEPDHAEIRSELDRLLRPLGVSEEELETLAQQFWKELDTLPQNKPLLTAIAAFGLGFVLGRMTK